MQKNDVWMRDLALVNDLHLLFIHSATAAEPFLGLLLALDAHMSPSTFRQHFREIAGMSPLQYQKQLRLQEARQLMLNEKLDASVAGTRVGYESVSQFNREYSRLFGAPPQRDIRRMRLSQTSRQ